MRLPAGPQRLHIDLRVEGVAFVDVPLKVDGQRRDDEQVAVKVHKAALDAVLGLDEGAPADGQRASSQVDMIIPP